MIYVTQGHEKSIAMEIFLKSFLKLSPSEQKKIVLVCQKKVYEENLSLLNLSCQNFQNLNLVEIESKGLSLTLTSLKKALELIKEKDILVTLPTSKDQLHELGVHHMGYTEYLRAMSGKPELAMTFKADEEFVLLMTDHIPLRAVTQILTKDYIQKKLAIVIEEYQKYFSSLEEVIVAGINPHAGEGGLLGDEDQEVFEALEKLKKSYPQISFIGPLSGDTLHFKQNIKRSQLMVYMYHDQGLPSFKARHGLKGINMTLGLPFLRMSVDHGTAFELYGKNQASEEGCQYVLKTALEISKEK